MGGSGVFPIVPAALFDFRRPPKQAAAAGTRVPTTLGRVPVRLVRTPRRGPGVPRGLRASTEEVRRLTGMALRKDGPVKITPLAADSLGARSMATLVETPDVTVLLDPSVRP